MDIITTQLNIATPWFWYLIRSAGILAFIFLWLTVFLGLAIRNPILKKIVTPIYSFGFHGFLAILSGFWVLLHIVGLLFDNQFSMTIPDILIPFHAKFAFINTNYLALGIIAFYLMVILVISSLLRKYYKRWVWRIMHYLSPVVLIFVVVHGVLNGTDMKNIYASLVFIFSAASLIVLYFSNLIFGFVAKSKVASS